jgi:hypothetical protein
MEESDSAADLPYFIDGGRPIQSPGIQYISKASGCPATIEFEGYTHDHSQNFLASDVGAYHHWLVQTESSTWPLRLSCLDETREYALGELDDFCAYTLAASPLEAGWSGKTGRNSARLFQGNLALREGQRCNTVNFAWLQTAYSHSFLRARCRKRRAVTSQESSIFGASSEVCKDTREVLLLETSDLLLEFHLRQIKSEFL